MKSKKRPRVSTKKCPIHEVKKVQRLKRKEKERNNNNNKKKKREDLDLVRPEDMQQEEGSRLG